MRRITTLAFLLWLWNSPSAFAEPISITTFNIEFYGSNTVIGAESGAIQAIDDRDDSIRRFFQIAGIDADVFAFEEIVDTGALTKNLLQDRYDCHSYEHSNRGHQHVVVCNKKEFTFRIANDDDNYTWEDVAMTTLRPAVHGILSKKNGRDLAHIIAVHLKAMPDRSAQRLEQTNMIAGHVKARGDQLPVVMLGDFNTYEDDIERFTDAFHNSGVQMTPIEIPFDYTYRTSRYTSKFDWFIVSDGVGVLKEVDVAGPCNRSWSSGTNYDDLAFYNESVSDHCPVSVVLDL